MKTANLAIVFTDIKGFTERTSRQTLEENQRLLDRHEKLLAPLFHAFGGRIIKSIGDAFMVTFESPTQAVLCGAAIQDRLWIHNRSAPEAERLDVRVAINVGEVRVENKDVFGEPVNIAARVEGIADAGEVFFTEAVYLAMNKADVPSEEVGAFELKGIPGKVRVYRIPHAPYRVEAPAPTPTPLEAKGDLPPFGNLGLSRVKERDRDDAGLRRLTDPGELRAAVSTLQRGATGLVEKTTSALEQARAHRPSWFRPRVAMGFAVALLGLGVGLQQVFRSEASAAISEVRDASGKDRDARVQKAREVIARIEEPADRAWWSGQLLEALGEIPGATGYYRTAVKSGNSSARSRLIDLLDNPACDARAASARVLGELEVEAARGDLEDLAENGGPGDQSGGGLIGKVFGCDSKAAATEALRRLDARSSKGK
ncbi:MAG: adenylate/guanylate cyclase domain-containing protein [Myxococcaceae bacterium]